MDLSYVTMTIVGVLWFGFENTDDLWGVAVLLAKNNYEQLLMFLMLCCEWVVAMVVASSTGPGYLLQFLLLPLLDTQAWCTWWLSLWWYWCWACTAPCELCVCLDWNLNPLWIIFVLVGAYLALWHYFWTDQWQLTLVFFNQFWFCSFCVCRVSRLQNLQGQEDPVVIV
jgi:hypothetical protein